LNRVGGLIGLYRRVVGWVCFGVVALAWLGQAQAASIRALQGEVRLERLGGGYAPQVGTRVNEGDTILTGNDGEALIRLDDGSQVLVRAGSALTLAGYPPRKQGVVLKAALRLNSGALRFSSKLSAAQKRREAEFLTPNATVGLRGTDFDLAYRPAAGPDGAAGTYVSVRRGGVALAERETGQTVEVAADEVAYAGEPEFAVRGVGRQRPEARKLSAIPPGLRQAGRLDRLLD
jgi:hypothetical protein